MPADHEVRAQFRQSFRLDDLTIHEEDGWVVSVRPSQITLGSMVISSATGRLDFQEIDADEAYGLARAFAWTEQVAKDELGAVRINLACLMMKDPIVHFHVLPRYDGPVGRYGIVWEDLDWPGPPTFSATPITESVLQAILTELRTVTPGPTDSSR